MNPILEPAIKTLEDGGPYIISNGMSVDTYIDMYQVILRGDKFTELLRLLKKDIIKNWPTHFNYIAGRETAGALIALRLGYEFRIPVIVVRDSKREQGTKNSLEVPKYKLADRIATKNVLLVDDVSSVGIGLKDSVGKLRHEGFKVIGAYSIVYRGLGASKVASDINV
ncbi:hypothetical protein LCGC14_2811590, partial [marine sediment metagenome]